MDAFTGNIIYKRDAFHFFFGIPGGRFFISIECREIFSHVRFVLLQSVNDSDDLVIRCFPETVYAAPWYDALMEKKWQSYS